jgi:hypothetical protein
MNYKRNEAGDVLVRDAKGNPKYIAEKLAKDAQLMKTMHMEVVEAPTFYEELKTTIIHENGSETKLDLTPIEESKKVAEPLTAKSKGTKTK